MPFQNVGGASWGWADSARNSDVVPQRCAPIRMKLGSRRSGAVSVLIWAYAYRPTRRSGSGVAADCARMKPPPRGLPVPIPVPPPGIEPIGHDSFGPPPSYSRLGDDPPGLADVSPLHFPRARRGLSAPCVT